MKKLFLTEKVFTEVMKASKPFIGDAKEVSEAFTYIQLTVNNGIMYVNATNKYIVLNLSIPVSTYSDNGIYFIPYIKPIKGCGEVTITTSESGNDIRLTVETTTEIKKFLIRDFTEFKYNKHFEEEYTTITHLAVKKLKAILSGFDDEDIIKLSNKPAKFSPIKIDCKQKSALIFPVNVKDE